MSTQSPSYTSTFSDKIFSTFLNNQKQQK